VHGIQKTKEFGGDFIVVFDSESDLANGMTIEVRRSMGEIDVPFAVVEIKGKARSGKTQGIPIWTAAAHQRDFFRGEFVASDLVALPFLEVSTLSKIIEAN
jgi:hypothetical protein